MTLPVTFTFVDSLARKTTRTWTTTSVTIVDALTDATALAALLDAVTEGGLQEITITRKDTAAAFAFSAGPNIDENASVKVPAADGRDYDFDLPMPIAALRLAGGAIDTANANFIALFDAFGVASAWRINNFTPTAISLVRSALLDT